MAKQQGSDRRPTKAERKEQARFERAEIQRRQAARSRNRTLGIVVGAVVVAIAIAGIVLFGGNGSNPTPPSAAAPTLPDPAALPGIMRVQPWPNNVAQMPERLDQLNLPAFGEGVGFLHHHIQVDVYVDGQQVVVPANIGITNSVFSPLHTHDDTGLVHVESSDPNFQPVLGQFMDIWGVYMTQTALGDAQNDGDKQLRVFVNGEQYTGDPTLLPLTDQLVVVITFGTKDQLPNPIPDTMPTI